MDTENEIAIFVEEINLRQKIADMLRSDFPVADAEDVLRKVCGCFDLDQEVQQKHLIIGAHQSVSIKPRNIKLNHNLLKALILGVSRVSADFLKGDILTIIFGVLICISEFLKLFVVDISKSDACVFCGCILAANEGDVAFFDDIAEHAKGLSEKFLILKLSENEVRQSILNLKSYGCLIEENNGYKIKENYTIVGSLV